MLSKDQTRKLSKRAQNGVVPMKNFGGRDPNSLTLAGSKLNQGSLIHTFPPEILLDIFALVPTPQVKNHPRALWVLAIVCRKWRNIVLLHSRLWSSITLSGYTLRGVADPESMLVIWLQRSGNHLLDIGYDLDKPGPLLTLLLLHSRRWKSLRLRISSSQLVPVLKSLAGRLPSLQTLCVDQLVRLTSDAFGAFFDAPKLLNVTLRLFHRGAITIPNLPWEKLTRVELNSTVLLHDTHNLHLPSLTDLILFHPGGPGSRIATVTSFLQRCSCSLQYLALSCFTATCASDMVELYQCMPRLVHFRVDIGFEDILDKILSPLLLTHDQCWLPKLQHLAIWTSAKTTANFEMAGDSGLAEAVESRSGGSAIGDTLTVTPLTSFTFWGYISPPTAHRLESVMSNGVMTVSLNPKFVPFPTLH